MKQTKFKQDSVASLNPTKLGVTKLSAIKFLDLFYITTLFATYHANAPAKEEGVLLPKAEKYTNITSESIEKCLDCIPQQDREKRNGLEIFLHTYHAVLEDARAAYALMKDPTIAWRVIIEFIETCGSGYSQELQQLAWKQIPDPDKDSAALKELNNWKKSFGKNLESKFVKRFMTSETKRSYEEGDHTIPVNMKAAWLQASWRAPLQERMKSVVTQSYLQGINTMFASCSNKDAIREHLQKSLDKYNEQLSQLHPRPENNNNHAAFISYLIQIFDKLNDKLECFDPITTLHLPVDKKKTKSLYIDFNDVNFTVMNYDELYKYCAGVIAHPQCLPQLQQPLRALLALLQPDKLAKINAYFIAQILEEEENTLRKLFLESDQGTSALAAVNEYDSLMEIELHDMQACTNHFKKRIRDVTYGTKPWSDIINMLLGYVQQYMLTFESKWKEAVESESKNHAKVIEYLKELAHDTDYKIHKMIEDEACELTILFDLRNPQKLGYVFSLETLNQQKAFDCQRVCSYLDEVIKSLPKNEDGSQTDAIKQIKAIKASYEANDFIQFLTLKMLLEKQQEYQPKIFEIMKASDVQKEIENIVTQYVSFAQQLEKNEIAIKISAIERMMKDKKEAIQQIVQTALTKRCKSLLNELTQAKEYDSNEQFNKHRMLQAIMQHFPYHDSCYDLTNPTQENYCTLIKLGSCAYPFVVFQPASCKFEISPLEPSKFAQFLDQYQQEMQTTALSAMNNEHTALTLLTHLNEQLPKQYQVKVFQHEEHNWEQIMHASLLVLAAAIPIKKNCFDHNLMTLADRFNSIVDSKKVQNRAQGIIMEILGAINKKRISSKILDQFENRCETAKNDPVYGIIFARPSTSEEKLLYCCTKMFIKYWGEYHDTNKYLGVKAFGISYIYTIGMGLLALYAILVQLDLGPLIYLTNLWLNMH